MQVPQADVSVHVGLSLAAWEAIARRTWRRELGELQDDRDTYMRGTSSRWGSLDVHFASGPCFKVIRESELYGVVRALSEVPGSFAL